MNSKESDVSELRELLQRATRVRDEIRHRDKGDGEERYDLIGDPCGFPVATFGDHNDAMFDLRARQYFATLSPLPSPGVERLREALEEIVNPLQFMRRRAEANGDRLSDMAYSIANDVEYLRGIARAALSALPLDGGGCASPPLSLTPSGIGEEGAA